MSAQNDTKSPIAIVGVGCRFPGQVNGPEDYWRLLRDGVDAVSEVPAERFDIAQFHGEQSGAAGTIAARHGGFIEGVDRFDAGFFGISPLEARQMDPQQRLLLQVAWEAMEDAGQGPVAGDGADVGVFVGMMSGDYAPLNMRAPDELDLYAVTGGLRNAVAGRVSHHLGLRGPSLVVDADRSSALVAVHLACQSLRRGESRLALAGAANLVLSPWPSVAFSRAGMLAPDGRCKFGDARADGFVRSDGVGVVVLKPLAQARADGDRVYAVIRGSAVNNAGDTSDDLRVPSPTAQRELLRRALADAEVEPDAVDYIEAHGTGTGVGDPIELEAIGEVVQPGRPTSAPCLVGSVKTNIGHAEGAAGMAGLIKTTLALHQGQVPASLHFVTPNPAIPFQRLPIAIPVALQPWPERGHRPVAGVSGFGLTGTNAHVVLARADAAAETPAAGRPPHAPHLLPLSARSEASLQQLARRYCDQLAEVSAEQDGGATWALCAAAAQRRRHHGRRLAAVAGSAAELREQLDGALRDVEDGLVPALGDTGVETPRLVYIFSGQGSQWPTMGTLLAEQEATFRQSLQRTEAELAKLADWSLVRELSASDEASRVGQEQVVAQCAIFAVQVGLVDLLHHWGVDPDAVLGHSLGEVAAAYCSGALSLEQAVQVVFHRGQLMGTRAGIGGMALVGLPAEQVAQAMEHYGDALCIAAINGPSSTAVSGDPEALTRLLEPWQRKEIFCRRIRTDVAGHSAQMDPLAEPLTAALASLAPRAARVPFYSTVTGEALPGEQLDADYWWRNMRQPVQFLGGVQRLLADGQSLFVEISPHPILTVGLEGILTAAQADARCFESARRDTLSRASLLPLVGSLYRSGYAVDWHALWQGQRPWRALPRYPWSERRFWLPGHELGREAAGTAVTATLAESQEADETPRAGAAEAIRKLARPEQAEAVQRFVSRQAAALLGYPAGHSFELQRPLKQYGADSLTSMRLKSVLEDHFAVRVPPGGFDELSTIHKVTELVAELLQAAPVASAEATQPPRAEALQPMPEEVESNIPLLPLQALNLINETQNPWMPTLMCIAARERFDRDALQRTLTILSDRHDALRYRFRRTFAGWRQMVAPRGESSVELIERDLSHRSDMPAALRELLEEMLALCDVERDRMMILALVQLAPEREVLLTVRHHLVMDAFSEGVLNRDLLRTYRAVVEERDESELTRSSGSWSLSRWAKSLHSMTHSGALDDDFEFWSSQTRKADELLPRDFPEPEPTNEGPVGFAGEVLSAEDVQRIRALAATHDDMSERDILYAAVLRALTRWTKGRVCTAFLHHGRRLDRVEAELSQTIGFLSTQVQLAFTADQPSLEESARYVNRKIQEMPNGGISCMALRMIRPHVFNYESLFETYDALLPAEVQFNYWGQQDPSWSIEQEDGFTVERLAQPPEGDEPFAIRVFNIPALRQAFEFSMSSNRLMVQLYLFSHFGALFLSYRSDLFAAETINGIMQQAAAELRAI